MADLSQITGRPDLDFVKIVLVQPRQRWGLDMGSKATVWEPRAPPAQISPTPVLGPPSGVKQGHMCTEGGVAAPWLG